MRVGGGKGEGRHVGRGRIRGNEGERRGSGRRDR